MQSLRGTSIAQIKAVPGLFISDRFAARSASMLRSLNIKYILSVTRSEDVPKLGDQFVTKHIDINDDTTEDILCYLQEACDWIETGLSSPLSNDGDTTNAKQIGVLVHCTMGISRSGAIVTAYLMRKLSLDYPDALSLVRESRALVSPNSGFEEQLRIWYSCDYDVYLPSDSPGGRTAAPEGKAAYKAWKANLESVLKRDDAEAVINRAQFAAAAGLAARFGKMRTENDDGEDKNNEKSEAEKTAEAERRKIAWEKVEKMEEEWTKRLIAGKEEDKTPK